MTEYALLFLFIVFALTWLVFFISRSDEAFTGAMINSFVLLICLLYKLIDFLTNS